MSNLTGKNHTFYGDSYESIFERPGRAKTSIYGGGVDGLYLSFLSGP